MNIFNFFSKLNTNQSSRLSTLTFEPRKILNVVPGILKNLPKQLISVTYPSGAKANLGNELTPRMVTYPPTVTWSGFEILWYCLTMTDPDAPYCSDPHLKEMLHWMVVNIHGTDLSRGDVIAPYIPCVPIKGSGLHRYVFAVYRQPGKVKFTEKRLSDDSFESRDSFSSHKFSKLYRLGEPIAYNWFVAEWDRSVPKTLHKMTNSHL